MRHLLASFFYFTEILFFLFAASSTASRKRKHRNSTGFPSSKKKKSKQKQIELPVKKHSPQSKKQSSPQSSPVNKKLKDTSPKSSKKHEEKQNSKSESNKSTKSVQLKLGMGKNGLSLKKPEKETQKVNIALPRRGRPPAKESSPKNSSKKLLANMKTKKAKIGKSYLLFRILPLDGDYLKLS